MKKLLRKFLAAFIAVVVSLVGTIPAYALTEGTKYSFTTKHLDLYYDTGRWTTANGDVHDNYGQVALRNLTSTGEPLYCLQIYNGVEGTAATAESIKDTDLWLYELNPSGRNGITLVSIYGYPNNNFGASSQDAQLATQVLIWEFETHARTNFNAGCDSWASNLLYNSATRNCYESILEACRNHQLYPSFNATTVSLDGVGSGYAKTLTDTNGVLSQFSVSSNNPNIKVSKSGNTLKVWSTSTGTQNATITCTKDATCINSAFALTGANQTLFYGTIADPQYAGFTVKMSTGDLKIVKTSEDGVVEGFTFQVNGAGYEKTGTTDKNGVVTFTGLPLGDCFITEPLSDEDDRYVGIERTKVTINANQTITFNAENILKKGSAEFVKIDSETGESILNGDGQFKCQEWSSSQNKYVDYKDFVFDEATSKYIVDELTYTKDNEGKFRCVEVVAPTGYYNSNQSFEFSISENGQNVIINDGKIVNDAQKGIVHLEKTGEILTGFEESETEYGVIYAPVYTETTLAGATYEFRAAEDIISNGKVVYKKGDVVDTITTTEDGATTKELPLGKYEYQEVTAPEGFVLDETIYTIELTYKGQEISVFTESVGTTDLRQKIDLNVYKDFEENIYFPNDNAYKDVLFAVYANEDILDQNGEVILAKDSIVDYITLDDPNAPDEDTSAGETSDSDTEQTETVDTIMSDNEESSSETTEKTDYYIGHSNTDLPLGYEWYVKELKTADGWYVDDTVYTFKTEVAEQTTDVIKIPLNDGQPIVNKLVTGYVEFRKVDADDADIQLEATYGVYRASDGKLLEKQTSKIGEWVRFTELPAGKYYLQEIASPNGYLISDMKYEFEINNENGGETIQIVATDTKAPVVEITSPDTGNDLSLFNGISLAVFAGSAILLIYLNKNKTWLKKYKRKFNR